MNIIKNSILGIIGITLMATPLILTPRKVHAQAAVVDPVNLVQNTLQVLQQGSQTFLQSSFNLKEFSLDLLLNVIAKQIINQMTQSVVNWINSGFQGSPSFITNPESFFIDAADQVTGAFLNQNGPLAALCSPFSFDIRLSLALQMSSRYNRRYTCTLGTVIQNSRDAAARGISINGFLAGDFSQGGWPAFITMTTEPQNSASGSWLYAHSDILARISEKESSINTDLNRGRGFLSFQKCQQVPINPEVLQSEDPNDPRLSNYYETGASTYEYCTTETPGSVIQTTLENQLGSGVRQLELADEINEIAGALVNQLVVQILNAGLKSASGSGSSDRRSPVNRLLAENEKSAEEIQRIARNMVKNMQKYIRDGRSYLAERVKMTAEVADVESHFAAARTCWADKGITAQVNALDQKISTDVTPFVRNVRAQHLQASTSLDTLLRIERQAQTVETAAQLQPLTIEFSDLLQDQSLATASQIQEAKTELREVRTTANNLVSFANQALSDCRAFRPELNQ